MKGGGGGRWRGEGMERRTQRKIMNETSVPWSHIGNTDKHMEGTK